MKKRIFYTSLCLTVACGSLSAVAGDYVSLEIKNPVGPDIITVKPRNYFRLSAGYIYRDLGDARFHSGSRSQNVALPNYFGGDRSSSHSPGLYQNGFVLPDATGSTDSLTWNWGYNDASQIQSGQLVFQSANRSSRETSAFSTHSPAGSFSNDIQEGGPYIQLEYMMSLNESGSLAWGPQLGFSFIDFDLSQTSSTFAAGQSSTDFTHSTTDRYDLGGITAPLAPYQGTPAGPGPLIGVAPTDSSTKTREVASGEVLFFNKLRESLDVEMYTFSPGVSFEIRKNAYYLNAAVGLAVNIVNWEAHNQETLYVSRDRGKARALKNWHDKSSDTDILLGAYVQATVGAQLTKKASISAFGRYDWNQDLKGSVGPSSFDADLSGLSAGAMITLRW
jgi:hypothetical protein